MIDEYDRSELRAVLKSRAFMVGDVSLSSGKISPYYINCKQAVLSADVAETLTEVLCGATSDLRLDAVGGMEVGAIPLTMLMVRQSRVNGEALEGFFVRKQPKVHGGGNRVEGNLKPGMRVCVLEDVVTTGASVLQACDEVEKVGAIVVRVVCLVDRLEGAREAIGARYDFRPVFTIRDFGVTP